MTRQSRTIGTRLDNLESKVEAGFSAVDDRLEQVDKRFEQVDTRFEQVDTRFEQVDTRLQGIDRSLAAQRSQFQAMHEEHMETFRSLYDLIKAQGERMERGFASLEAKIDARLADHEAVLRDHARRLLKLEGQARKS